MKNGMLTRFAILLMMLWHTGGCADEPETSTASPRDTASPPRDTDSGTGADEQVDTSSATVSASDTVTETAGTPDTESATTHPPHTVDASVVTRGGTMTFTNIGATGWWPRRLNKPNGDAACDYKDGTDTWGGVCCMEKHFTESDRISPFDEEMILILKTLNVKQLAVYQPAKSSPATSWELISFFDDRDTAASNLVFTGGGDEYAVFNGSLTGDDCVWYVMQNQPFGCDDFDEYFCPEDPGINHLGWSGSKLIAFLGNMTVDDSTVGACSGDGSGHPGPWVAFVAAELIRDGARKWNGLCNCYSRTDSVGDGCGEINVFEVVMDNNDYSNREFISTGIRSFQAGHIGGSVCGAGCARDDVADDVEVVDACSRTAYVAGPEVVAGGASDGCPVWRRPVGDRVFLILLDEETRTIQVAIIHPSNIPDPLRDIFPEFPSRISRDTVDGLIGMRLP